MIKLKGRSIRNMIGYNEIIIGYVLFLLFDGTMFYFLWNTLCDYLSIEHIGYWTALLVMLLYKLIRMRKTVTFKDGYKISYK